MKRAIIASAAMLSLLAAPVWFNEEAINGKYKWTLQLDINVPSFSK